MATYFPPIAPSTVVGNQNNMGYFPASVPDPTWMDPSLTQDMWYVWHPHDPNSAYAVNPQGPGAAPPPSDLLQQTPIYMHTWSHPGGPITNLPLIPQPPSAYDARLPQVGGAPTRPKAPFRKHRGSGKLNQPFALRNSPQMGLGFIPQPPTAAPRRRRVTSALGKTPKLATTSRWIVVEEVEVGPKSDKPPFVVPMAPGVLPKEPYVHWTTEFAPDKFKSFHDRIQKAMESEQLKWDAEHSGALAATDLGPTDAAAATVPKIPRKPKQQPPAGSKTVTESPRRYQKPTDGGESGTEGKPPQRRKRVKAKPQSEEDLPPKYYIRPFPMKKFDAPSPRPKKVQERVLKAPSSSSSQMIPSISANDMATSSSTDASEPETTNNNKNRIAKPRGKPSPSPSKKVAPKLSQSALSAGEEDEEPLALSDMLNSLRGSTDASSPIIVTPQKSTGNNKAVPKVVTPKTLGAPQDGRSPGAATSPMSTARRRETVFPQQQLSTSSPAKRTPATTPARSKSIGASPIKYISPRDLSPGSKRSYFPTEESLRLEQKELRTRGDLQSEAWVQLYGILEKAFSAQFMRRSGRGAPSGPQLYTLLGELMGIENERRGALEDHQTVARLRILMVMEERLRRTWEDKEMVERTRMFRYIADVLEDAASRAQFLEGPIEDVEAHYRRMIVRQEEEARVGIAQYIADCLMGFVELVGGPTGDPYRYPISPVSDYPYGFGYSSTTPDAAHWLQESVNDLVRQEMVARNAIAQLEIERRVQVIQTAAQNLFSRMGAKAFSMMKKIPIEQSAQQSVEGTLRIVVESASRILGVHCEPNPMLELTIGDETHRTSIKSCTHDPVWNEAFMVKVPTYLAEDGFMCFEELFLQVLDEYPQPGFLRSVCRATIPLSFLQRQTVHPMTIEMTPVGQVKLQLTPLNFGLRQDASQMNAAMMMDAVKRVGVIEHEMRVRYSELEHRARLLLLQEQELSQRDLLEAQFMAWHTSVLSNNLGIKKTVFNMQLNMASRVLEDVERSLRDLFEFQQASAWQELLHLFEQETLVVAAKLYSKSPNSQWPAPPTPDESFEFVATSSSELVNVYLRRRWAIEIQEEIARNFLFEALVRGFLYNAEAYEWAYIRLREEEDWTRMHVKVIERAWIRYAFRKIPVSARVAVQKKLAHDQAMELYRQQTQQRALNVISPYQAMAQQTALVPPIGPNALTAPPPVVQFNPVTQTYYWDVISRSGDSSGLMVGRK